MLESRDGVRGCKPQQRNYDSFHCFSPMFVGTVELTDKKSFAFFKRPTGAVFTDEVNAAHAADVASVIAPDVTLSPSVATVSSL